MTPVRSAFALFCLATTFGFSGAETCDTESGTCTTPEAASGSVLLAKAVRTKRGKTTADEDDSHDILAAVDAEGMSDPMASVAFTEAAPRIMLTVVGATHLPNADPTWSWYATDSSDPYVICSVPGKSGHDFHTPVVHDSHDPTWGHTDELEGWAEGDSMKCTVWDSDLLHDDSLGSATLSSSQFYPDGFDGQVSLGGPGQLHLKIQVERIVVYFDGATPTALPKRKVDYAPERMFVSVPIGESSPDVVVDDDSVFFANNAKIQGLYNRNTSMSAGWASDYGVVNWIVSPNPMSLFPNSVFGFAEKNLVLGQQGMVSDASHARVIEEHAGRNAADHWLASSTAGARHKLVILENMKGKVTKALADGGMDTKQLAELYKALNTGTLEPQSSASSLKDELHSTLKAAMAGSGADDILATGNGCMHVTAGSVTVTDEGLRIPFRQEIVVFRGVTVFAPFATFSILVSTMYVDYNEDSHTLEISISAASKVVLEDPSIDGPKPVFFQGPPHTLGDHRSQLSQKDTAANLLYKAVHKMHADYGFMWDDASCQGDAATDIKNRLERFSWVEAVHSARTGGLSLAKTMELVQLSSDALACGKPYLKSSIASSHSFGFIESAVWLHLLMEIRPVDVWATISHDWDDLTILAS